MADIRPQRIASKESKTSKRELYAIVCYYYPQYTLTDVAALPHRDVQLLLRTATKQEASRMFQLTQIAAAPHSKKQINVSKLLEHFKKAAGK